MMLAILQNFFVMKKEKGISIIFWSLLGPIFIILTLFLTTFSHVPNKDLFLFALLGFYLCLKKGKNGFLFASIFLFALIVLKHFQIDQDIFLQLGIEFSLFLGLFISYNSFEYVRDILAGLDINKKKYDGDINQLKNELDKNINFYERQINSIKEELDKKKIQFEEKCEEIFAFKNKVQNLKKEIDENEKRFLKYEDLLNEKEKKNTFLAQEINQLKETILNLEDGSFSENSSFLKEELENAIHEKNEAYIINESLTSKLEEEIEKRKEIEKKYHLHLDNLKKEIDHLKKLNESLDQTKNTNEIFSSEDKKLLEDYENKVIELKEFQSLYYQTRKNFEEKKDLLDQTRKELFLLNEKILAKDKEMQMHKLELPDEIDDLNEKMEKCSRLISFLENENAELEEIISKVFNESN